MECSVEDLLALEDPLLEAKFPAGNPANKEDHFLHLKSKLDYFSRELKQGE